MHNADRRVAVVGLGYVGLPVAIAFAKKFSGIIGFDIKEKRIAELKNFQDKTNEVSAEELKKSQIHFTANRQDLKAADFFIVAVPTPIDQDKRPDLSALISACEIVAQCLKKGDIVVFESTVYPGVTEEICGKILANGSGLKQSSDFKLGYSPERINPGDKEHTLEKIIKVVSGEDAETLEIISQVYGKVVTAGIFKASSIKVAEAAKAIENTQRDLNIALMNELSIIFDRIGISTKDVLDAAATKWNFLRFNPGLVGGHCIGVDPYYLTTKAEQLGYQPQVILAGRRINDNMGTYIANRTLKLMANAGTVMKNAKVGILGITFKENINDIRNSRVPDIAAELKEYGVHVLVHDPLANSQEVKEEYGFDLVSTESLKDLDALIMAVSHQEFMKKKLAQYIKMLKPKGVFVDIKSVFDPQEVPEGYLYWRL